MKNIISIKIKEVSETRAGFKVKMTSDEKKLTWGIATVMLANPIFTDAVFEALEILKRTIDKAEKEDKESMEILEDFLKENNIKLSDINPNEN